MAKTKASRPIYLNPSRPIPERVQDLIARMTLQEKLGQFIHPVSAVPRLGMIAYNFWNEALHGVPPLCHPDTRSLIRVS